MKDCYICVTLRGWINSAAINFISYQVAASRNSISANQFTVPKRLMHTLRRFGDLPIDLLPWRVLKARIWFNFTTQSPILFITHRVWLIFLHRRPATSLYVHISHFGTCCWQTQWQPWQHGQNLLSRTTVAKNKKSSLWCYGIELMQ